VVRIAPESLPSGLGHEPTREFLSQVGIPDHVAEFFSLAPGFVAGPATVAQLYPSILDEVPGSVRGWLHLGAIADGQLCLDGSDGRLWYLPNWLQQPRPVNTDVAAFAEFLLVIRRTRQEREEGWSYSEYVERTRVVVPELTSRDPVGFEGPGSFWAVALRNGLASLEGAGMASRDEAPWADPSLPTHVIGRPVVAVRTAPEPEPEADARRVFGADRMARFDEAWLPPALTHERTRSFLTEHGLPRRFQNLLELREDLDQGLRTVAELYPGTGRLTQPGQEGLLVLGHFDTGDLCLDGADGTVYWLPPHSAVPVLLAGGVAQLAAILALLERELPALRERLSDLDSWSDALAPLKRIDPYACGDFGQFWPDLRRRFGRELCTGGAPRGHRVPGSRRGLIAPGPTGVAEQLRESFAGRLVRYPEAVLPAGISHEPTRRFLAEVGLPRWLIDPELPDEAPLPTVAEAELRDAAEDGDEEECGDLGHGSADLYVLGWLESQSFLCLDGRTGELYRLSEYGALPDLVSSSAQAAAGVCDRLWRSGGMLDGLDARAKREAIEHLAAELEALDPAAWADRTQEWPGLVAHHERIALFEAERPDEDGEWEERRES
jgi:hypothetical protein